MKADDRAYLRAALSRAKGDDLERAEHYFKGFSNEEMQKPYMAHSKETRQQVLDGYRAERRKWTYAKDYLEELLAKDPV